MTGRYISRNRHGTVYYVRVRVPAPLQTLLGRKEIRRSLGDLPPRLARLRAAEIAARLATCFALLMDAKKKLPPGVDDSGIMPVAHLNIVEIVRDVDGKLTLSGIQIDPENYEADVAALNGILGSSPGVAPAPTASKFTYADLVAAHVMEHVVGKVWTAKSQQEVEAILNRYGDRCKAANLDPYTKEAAVAFKSFCVGKLATRTTNKHITRLIALFDWGVDHGHCSANPFSGLKPKKARGRAVARDEREAWTDNEITTLLHALRPAEEGRDWLPLLGVYTGARVNELCQLHLDDIKTDSESGVSYLDVNASRPDQRLKNAGSARLIPLHKAVLRAGFLNHVAALRAAGETRLFPKFRGGRDGYGQAGSRWFGRRRQGLKLEKDFHGLRHTISTKLREAGVEETTVNELLGHSYGKSMSFSRYAKAQGLTKLAAVSVLALFDVLVSALFDGTLRFRFPCSLDRSSSIAG